MIGENFFKILEDVENARKLITDYRDLLIISKKWNLENDIRIRFINQLNQILINHNLNIKFINENISNYNWIQKTLSVPDKENWFLVKESYINYNKVALIYTLSSVTERYLRLILKSLDNTTPITSSFYSIRTKVFDLLGIDKNSFSWYALSTLSNIRNTIHHNGIYLTDEEKLFEIRYKYHDTYIWFKNHNPQMNATYEIINYIIHDILWLSKQINEHESINNIEINEDFTIYF